MDGTKKMSAAQTLRSILADAGISAKVSSGNLARATNDGFRRSGSRAIATISLDATTSESRAALHAARSRHLGLRVDVVMSDLVITLEAR